MRSAKSPDPNRCPECAGRLSDSSPTGPCPGCLMKLGLQSWQTNQSLQQFRLEPTIGADNSPTGNFSVDELGEKFPQFELLHLVGAGGMGTVYCAKQKSLNRLVALKVIKPDANTRAEFEDRFVREARAMAQLNHQNIITVHDFGQVDGIYYFVMEYVDGINLRQMIRGNKLSAKHALEIVPSICDALQYAHDKGIVHRDIKPENILIDTNGVVKIADFGLAKLLDQETTGPQLTQANHVMGTMHYMAPEQIETPLHVDHRADIYSLGVVIYELLTGELPLGRFDPPSHKVSIDVRLDEIVLQSLAKEPARRYQRVSDVKSELTSVSSRRQESPLPPAAAVVKSPGIQKPPVVNNETFSSIMSGPIPKCNFLVSVVHPGTWLNAAYLLLSLPFGIFYFVLVVTGLSTGIGTLIIWVGIPLLLLTFALIRGCMSLDRSMVRNMLLTDVPVIRYRHPDETKTTIDRARELAFSSETWKGVFYLVSKLPLGIASFTVCITTVSITLALIAAPIGVGVFNVEYNFGLFEVDNYPLSTIFSMIGLLSAPVTAWVINRMAWVNAQWARLWLSRR